MKAVILAGGSGTRLWPLSREKFPKQFLSLCDTGNSLLQDTVLRLKKYFGEEIYIVSSGETRFLIERELNGILENLKDKIIIEPIGRNTAPAILYSSIFFDSNEIMAIFPADHLIKKTENFNNILKQAETLALKNYIITFGIVPTKPHTGYGYIETSKESIEQGFKVSSFKEKPNLSTAEQYINKGNYYWNSGIFVFKISLLYQEMAKYSKDLTDTLYIIQKLHEENKKINIEDYIKFRKVSIDYAVMEKTNKMVIIPSDIGWSDIGSWKALYDKRDKNNEGISVNSEFLEKGKFYSETTKNTLVFGKNRIIATIGVSNLVIVDTDDALLISNMDNSEKVKLIAERLMHDERVEYLTHNRVIRPWGSYVNLSKRDKYRIKRIEILPQQKLSLQLHHKRSEHWTVVSGTARITLGNEVIDIEENNSIFIPVETKHRIENITDKILIIIEIQYGDYLEEDDIERFDDIYGRV